MSDSASNGMRVATSSIHHHCCGHCRATINIPPHVEIVPLAVVTTAGGKIPTWEGKTIVAIVLIAIAGAPATAAVAAMTD